MKNFIHTLRPITILAILAVFACIAVAPSAALAGGSTNQSNKNMWRNLAIGSGVVAGYGLLHHNNTATLLGAAGAGYSAYRYEQDRKAQSAASRERGYYYRHRYMRYHRASAPTTYYRGDRKYYTFDGHRYYENMSTGARVRID